MPELLATPLARRPELLIRPLGDDGRFVVKNPVTGEYFHLGEEEHFLLTQLDGRTDSERIRAVYELQFGQALSVEELDEFVAMLREQGLLAAQESRCPVRSGDQRAEADSAPAKSRSILHWRISLWDPDRPFTWLAPRLWFFWTRTFLCFSGGCILLAGWFVLANRYELAGSFRSALRWETVAIGWVALFVVTLLHECAHGLTCKYHGGQVHEVGFLCMYFMPCFYCNVSDAWLFREKSKRLWVTFAGGYFELFLWALAVFAWRLTDRETTANYLAFVVLTVCGVQVLFNFNPLLKLDGYYLLSDWKEVPNLHQRGHDCFKGHIRRLFWGASRPAAEPGGRLLARYGLASWVFSLGFLVLVLWGMFTCLGPRWGGFGLAVVAIVGVLGIRGLFRGVFGGEMRSMILFRRKRTLIWLAILGAGAGCLFIPFEDRAGGPFQLRSAVRIEVRAPVAGFVKEVCRDDGDRVSPGAVVVRLEVPDLASRMAQKRADIRRSESRLQVLAEEVCEQRRRVARSGRWNDLAKVDSARAERTLMEELARLDKQVEQAQAESEAAIASLARARDAQTRGVAASEQIEEAERRSRAGTAALAQAKAMRRACEVRGTVESKLELDRRGHDLAEAQASLENLETGGRPKEMEAERARLDSLREEERYLENLQAKLNVCSPAAGVVTTPRLKEKVGHFVREGELICVIEEPSRLEVEIALPEQEAARVRPGQEVGLKPRTLPFETISAQVDRIASTAEKSEGQGTVTVYCVLADSPPALRPGTTGYGRIYTGQRTIGAVIAERAARLVRTELWW